MLKRNHVVLVIASGRTGQSEETVGGPAVEELILKLRKDVLLKSSLLRVEARHGLDKPECKLLVHIVVLQMGRPQQLAVLPNYGVDAPKVLFYELISLREGVIVVHVHFLSL